ncbi:MAG: hypothetical protein WC222_03430 [Parachlamydiales bacterium]|jgi:type IV pilus assembly protein PilM
MSESPTATHSLGLEHEGPHIRGAELAYARKKIFCKRTFIIDATKGEEDVKPLYMSEYGKSLEKSARASVVVTGMDTAKTIVRQLDVKLKKEKDIDAVLSFQAEPVIPFSPEEAVLDKTLINTYDEGSILTLYAVKKEQLKEHIEGWLQLGVESEIVSSIPFGLSSFAAAFITEEQPVVVLNIGFLSTSVILVQKGKLLASQSFKKGLHDLAIAYQHDLNKELDGNDDFEALAGVDLLHNNSDLQPEFHSTLQQYQRECVRSAFGLAKYARVGDVAGILVTGEGEKLKTLPGLIAQAIGKPLIPITLPGGFGITEQRACSNAIPIGLALTALPNYKSQINFRQEDFAYPHPWKRLRLPIAAYIAMCALLAFTTYLFGQAYIGLKEDSARQSYVNLVGTLKKDYPEFEKKIASEISNDVGYAPPSPKELTPNQINTRLDLFEKEIDAAPNTIALSANVPRVSDVLAWLSNHPQVAMPGKDGLPQAQIHIDSFNYRMSKRPELTKLRDKYQAQIDIDFVSDSPRAARLFYDSLIAPNDFVDPKGEVKWTAANGKYRVSFFLKDKTVYPNP